MTSVIMIAPLNADNFESGNALENDVLSADGVGGSVWAPLNLTDIVPEVTSEDNGKVLTALYQGSPFPSIGKMWQSFLVLLGADNAAGGAVLTADGVGGAAWEDAAGGGGAASPLGAPITVTQDWTDGGGCALDVIAAFSLTMRQYLTLTFLLFCGGDAVCLQIQTPEEANVMYGTYTYDYGAASWTNIPAIGQTAYCQLIGYAVL